MENQEIKPNQRWFALTKENVKGTQHQVILVEKDEDINEGNLPEEPVIYTWSDPLNDEKSGGISWRGPESEFRKIFRFIGFNNKK